MNLTDYVRTYSGVASIFVDKRVACVATFWLGGSNGCVCNASCLLQSSSTHLICASALNESKLGGVAGVKLSSESERMSKLGWDGVKAP